MDRRRVVSSSVYAVGYEADVLEVQFHARGCVGKDVTLVAPCVCGGGAVYSYTGVPAATHAALMEAASVGRYVQREIVGKFTGRRVDGEGGAR